MANEDENWKYTIDINDNTTYHVPLKKVLSDNNIIIKETYDNVFENMTDFRTYVRDIVRQIAEAYDMVQTVNKAAVTKGLYDEYYIDLEDDEPYDEYTFITVEYVIYGEEATITVSDRLDSTYNTYRSEIRNKSPVLVFIAVEGELNQRNILDFCLSNLSWDINIGVDIFDFGRGGELVATFPYSGNNYAQIENYVRSVFRSIQEDGDVETNEYNVDWTDMESKNEASVIISTTLIQREGIPQYVDQLVQGEQYTVLSIGDTLDLADFQKLRKFYIERKLIYDNYFLEADDVGCMGLGIGSENVEYPVRTSGGGIFCVKSLSRWIAAGNTTDPNRAEIETIHVMTEEEIIEQEWADIENQKNTLNTEINILKKERKETTNNKRAQELRIKLIKKESQLKKLPDTRQDHMAKKLERRRMNRIFSKLKF